MMSHFLVAPQDRRRIADHCLELLGRVIGTHLLEEPQHHPQDHHHENDHRGPLVTGQEGKHAQGREQQDQGILEVVEEAHQNRLVLLPGDFVRPILLQAGCGFRRAQAALLRVKFLHEEVDIFPRLLQQIRRSLFPLCPRREA